MSPKSGARRETGCPLGAREPGDLAGIRGLPAAGWARKPKAQSVQKRGRGVEPRHTTCEAAEPDWRRRGRRRLRREGLGLRRTTGNLTHSQHRVGNGCRGGDRRRKKLQEIQKQLRRKMHDPVAQVGGWLKSVLNGDYQYHAVPGNLTVLARFRRQGARYWFHALEQRGQRRPTWEKLGKIIDRWLPVPRVVHEYPDARFHASRRAAAQPK
jgi:hypothetical protein